MLCEHCKKEEAMGEFQFGPPHARKWRLCQPCQEEFLTERGLPTVKQMDQKIKGTSGWASFSPDELKHRP